MQDARSRYTAACAVLLFSVGGALSVFAQGGEQVPLQLDVQGGDDHEDSCLRAAPLRARISHYMARKSAASGLRIVVDLKQLASNNSAELRIYRADALLSRRRFERLPAACDDRRDAVALSIALALEDPAVTAPAHSSSSDAVVSPTDAAAEVTPAEVLTEPAAESGREPAAAADSDTTESADDQAPVVLGTLPSTISHSRAGDVSLGLQLQLSARWLLGALPFPVWVGGLAVALPVSKRIAIALAALASTLGETNFQTGHARGRLYGLEAIGCGSLPLGAAGTLDLCVGSAIAACDVSGRDYPLARPDTTLLWAAGLARAALRWPADTTFSLRLFVQGHVNLSRPTLQVERATRELKPGWLGAMPGLELVITLQ